MKRATTGLTVISLAMLGACGGPGGEPDTATVSVDCPGADESGTIHIAPGLSARVIETGYGRVAVDGDYADTNVWLWHLDEAADDRRGQFVWESGENVFQFQLGRGQVIRGWDLGVPCMLVGETRELVVAPELAYGAAGRGDAIPPNTPLIFTIELLKLTSPD
ncbi:MAG TPA: FKBP-type peptidyl-prolyl cis-trans isomerase [Woeseiaceae bacterium]|nr:FKBP-type peptidyl-prolyl cis-trans isomerase [Woeseiaceae bacterium]